jgi:hypothetical protein
VALSGSTPTGRTRGPTPGRHGLRFPRSDPSVHGAAPARGAVKRVCPPVGHCWDTSLFAGADSALFVRTGLGSRCQPSRSFAPIPIAPGQGLAPGRRLGLQMQPPTHVGFGCPAAGRLGRTRRPRWLAGAVVVLAALASTGTAFADSGNLLSNGSFASGTSGWKTTNATLSIASDGFGDAAAGRVVLSTTSSAYQVYAAPRPVLSTTAGLVYTAGGVVRSDTSGKTVCLQLKEFTSGGSLVVAATPSGLTLKWRSVW